MSKVKDYTCSAENCNRQASVRYKNKPYCNKHWLRLYNHGDLSIHERKSTNRFVNKGDYYVGVTAKGDEYLFDACDFKKVSRYSWTTNKNGNYLVANINHKVTRLSRYLLEPSRNEVVDHINGNVLDNRRSNLRIASVKENSRNNRVSKNNISGHIGISIRHNKCSPDTYRARIMVNGVEIRLGTYHTIEEADKAREAAEIKYFGEYAPSLSRKRRGERRNATTSTIG